MFGYSELVARYGYKKMPERFKEKEKSFTKLGCQVVVKVGLIAIQKISKTIRIYCRIQIMWSTNQ